MVEHASLALLDEGNILVHLKGNLQVLLRQLKPNTKSAKKMKVQNMGDEAYCLIRKSSGCESLKFEVGKVMAKTIKRFKEP